MSGWWLVCAASLVGAAGAASWCQRRLVEEVDDLETALAGIPGLRARVTGLRLGLVRSGRTARAQQARWAGGGATTPDEDCGGVRGDRRGGAARGGVDPQADSQW